MAYTTINKSTDYFNTVLYTGNGTDDHAITGVGFQANFIWIKARSAAKEHRLQNSVSGITNHLRSNSTTAESSGSVKTADSDGFTLGTSLSWNQNSTTYASWNWLAGGTASSNTDGSITSSVSASTTAGFSIGTFTGNATAGATIGHGLGTTPAWIICRTISAAKDWCVYHHKNTSAPETEVLILNSTAATSDTNDRWNDTAPTSSVFTIGDSSQLNTSSGTSLFYAFAEKKGYSKFGSYTGNGNADGTFVYTGFKPSWLMYKRTDSAHGWFMLDNKRDTFNVSYKMLRAENNDAEDTGSSPVVDFLSNGFKMRNAYASANASGGTYIYLAFAESPFVNSNGVPNNAR